MCAGLLLGYWALLSLVPVPGHGVGNFAEGANLANYVGRHFIDFEGMAKLFVGGPVYAYFGRYGELVLAATTLAFGFLFLRFLYQRKIFLRV